MLILKTSALQMRKDRVVATSTKLNTSQIIPKDSASREKNIKFT